MKDGTPPESPHFTRLWWILVLVVAAFYAAYLLRNSQLINGTRYFSLFDDAMISMRYAENLAAGHGLVWNPEDRPVEGFSNPLWTLWMTVLHLLPVTKAKVSLLVTCSGALLLLANLWLLWRIGDKVGLSKAAKGYLVFATGFFYPLVFWTLRGFETGLTSTLLLAGVLLVMRLETPESPWNTLRLAGLIALGLVTRPEFAAPGMLLVLGALVLSPPRTRFKRGLVLLGALFTLVSAAITLRFWYFGELVPNTYFLKLGEAGLTERVEMGLYRLGRHLEYQSWPFLALLLPSWIFLRRMRGRSLLLVAGIVAAQVAFSLYAGGDAWEDLRFANRYLAVVGPLAILMSVVALEEIATAMTRLIQQRKWIQRGPKTIAATLFLAPGLLMFYAVNGHDFSNWARHGSQAITWEHDLVKQGLRIRHQTPPETVIAVVTAGAIPYFAERTAIDLMGKADPVIAKGPANSNQTFFYPGHTKWNYHHSIGELRPDLIVQTYLLKKEDKDYFERLGYLPVSSPLGEFMTTEFNQRLKRFETRAPVADPEIPTHDPPNP